MGYIDDNKLAWEEAFEQRKPNWGEDDYLRIKNEKLPFLNPDVKEYLLNIDFTDKSVAQFCCNNGHELLSLMQLGAKDGAGFDIAENIISQAKEIADKSSISNCSFEAYNILDIPSLYFNRFDFIFFTIGAIGWFEDLELLFDKARKRLKDGGLLLINDFHPFINMLPLPSEDCFNEKDLNRVTYSYFRKEPWISNAGMGYMTSEYKSKTFTSFSHTLAGIIVAASANGLKTIHLNENDYDIGITDIYNGKGFPLSFTLVAQKC